MRPYELVSYTHSSGDEDRIVAELAVDGEPQEIEGVGNGPIAALVDAFERQLRDRDPHPRLPRARDGGGADATAAAYVEADVDDDPVWGVGLHPSIVTASLRAVVNAVNRAVVQRQLVVGATRARQE